MIKTETDGPIVKTEFKGTPNLIMKECAVTCAVILKEFRVQAVDKGADREVINANLDQILNMVRNELFNEGTEKTTLLQ